MSLRPSAIARSMLAARRAASAESSAPSATALVRSATAVLARRAGLATAVLGDDIDIIPLLDHLVLAQFEPAVADELAGPEVVFVAVPGTHEVHLAVGEVEPARGLVRHDPLFHLGNDQAFAGGPALMQADIAVGIELAVVPEHADLAISGEDDAALAIVDFRSLTDKLLGHSSPTLPGRLLLLSACAATFAACPSRIGSRRLALYITISAKGNQRRCSAMLFNLPFRRTHRLCRSRMALTRSRVGWCVQLG